MDTETFSRYQGNESWDTAAMNATNDIFNHVLKHKTAGKSIDDVRAYLDASIALNWEIKDRPMVARYSSWREVGASAVLLAKNLGLPLTEEIVWQTLVRKQRDYGHENIRRFGAEGLFVRLHDKVARLENLITKGATPENESLQDNMMDVVGYCAIGCMWEAGVFLLPLESGLEVAS
jgi:hypothetical protein